MDFRTLFNKLIFPICFVFISIIFQSPPTKVQYAIVIDAGSTGTRIHVYTFEFIPSSNRRVLLQDLFEQVSPGLSSFADNPEEAANSVEPLLQIAVEHIPVEYHHCTPISISATAGLRLLPGRKADEILDIIRKRLNERYPFIVSSVSIIDGQEEAIHAWTTVNYLLGKFDSKSVLGEKKITAGVMDLGGGSTQIVFEPKFQEHSQNVGNPTCKVPPPSLEGCGEFYQEKHLKPFTYTIYQHSYLGYGLIEARNKILSSVLYHHEYVQISQNNHPYIRHYSSERIISHPCLPKKFSQVVNGETVVGYSDNFVAAHDKCSQLVSRIFDKQTCTYEPNQCSFNGIFQPDLHETFTEYPDSEFYVFSYFYDRTRLILDMHDSQFDQWTVGDLKLLSKVVCSLHHDDKILVDQEFAKLHGTHFKTRFNTLSQFSKYLHQKIHVESDQYLCMDLTYMYHLLSTGYELKDTQQLRIQKKIGDFEMGWCLGAALDMLNGMNTKCLNDEEEEEKLL